MNLHMNFRDKTNGENIQYRFILFYFIFGLENLQYKAEKLWKPQFFIIKKTVEFNLNIAS